MGVLHAQEGGNIVKSLARDQSKNRKWTRTTPYTCMLSARVPIELSDQLRGFVDYTGATTTDVICRALREYLKQHSPMEQLQEGGSEE